MLLHSQCCIRYTVSIFFSSSLSFLIFGVIVKFSLFFCHNTILRTGTGVQETGHKTKGHTCLSDEDRDCTKVVKGSLLYGELLPRGVNKALGSNHLNAASCKTLFDMGMGIGKVVIQAFLQFRNLEFVYGVELSTGRYNIAEESVLRMVALFGSDAFNVERVPGVSITIVEKQVEEGDRCRILKLERGNMFDVSNVEMADVLMLETDVPSEFHPELCEMLSSLKIGAQTLTYLDLRLIWPNDSFCFRQVTINRSITDRFPTSWSVQRGHHFYLWTVVHPDDSDLHLGQMDSSSRNYADLVGFSSKILDTGSPDGSSRHSSPNGRWSGSVGDNGEGHGLARKKRQPRPILNFLRKIFYSPFSTAASSSSSRRTTDADQDVDDASGLDDLSNGSASVKASCFPNLFRGPRNSPDVDEGPRVIPLGNKTNM